jgi:hypothetical protein
LSGLILPSVLGCNDDDSDDDNNNYNDNGDGSGDGADSKSVKGAPRDADAAAAAADAAERALFVADKQQRGRRLPSDALVLLCLRRFRARASYAQQTRRFGTRFLLHAFFFRLQSLCY